MGDWDKLKQAGSGASLTRLKEAESLLCYFWNAYRECKGICPKKLALEILAAFVRTARALKVCKDLAKDDLKLEMVEQKLHERLGPANLPEAS